MDFKEINQNMKHKYKVVVLVIKPTVFDLLDAVIIVVA